MIFYKRYLQILFYFVFMIIVGCNSTNSTWYFEQEGTKLLLSETDVPSDWMLEAESINQLPVPDTENASVRYNLPADRFLTNSLIAHRVIIFDDAKDAENFMTADYKIDLELAEQLVKGREFQWSEFSSPQKHLYKSPLADEIKQLYYPEISVLGPLVGYNYYVWARYGNVVSTFITIVEDPETTQITAEEANVVPWSEVERMLKRIDEKFAAAGKEANQ